MNTPHKHAELWMQYAQDAAKIDNPWVLYHFYLPVDRLYEDPNSDGNFASNLSRLGRKPNADAILAEMLKPKLTPVDMSVLVGFDCNYAKLDTFETWFAPLGAVLHECYELESGRVFRKCKPRMNYWFSTRNFSDPDSLASRLIKAGFVLAVNKDAIQVLCLCNGFCWPWEVSR
jgi:hypothetical protein